MIVGVTGLNGAGKTAYAVGMLRRYQARGIRTAANIGVEGSDLVRTFEQLMELRNCVLLLDEITAVASSRQFASLTPEALLFFQTLRHANVGCIWTAPTFERADLALRSLTLKWIALNPLIRTRSAGGIWANTRLALVRSGRPVEGAEGTGSKMLMPWFSLYRPALHYTAYDSYADVDLFTRAAKFPRSCPTCGVGVNYGSLRVSSLPVDPGDLDREYFCANCGQSLGRVTRPSSLAEQLHTLDASGVNPPPPDPATRAPEAVPDPFAELLRG